MAHIADGRLHLLCRPIRLRHSAAPSLYLRKTGVSSLANRYRGPAAARLSLSLLPSRAHTTYIIARLTLYTYTLLPPPPPPQSSSSSHTLYLYHYQAHPF
ncbi:hypothetical protein ACJQWK_04590 [Exserohilum turcicum]